MPELTWQKSTYSAEAANCVEIAATPTTIHIRDSKTPAGPHLTLRPTVWVYFLSHAPDASR
ncbi:DUF397 domain-containing protein [Streptomyces dysideae]|uniref:DNA-binding protein n=1 Tax=Streptomyces dysideae TaxID=909626 RepID=A0A117RZW2_9ACTN|nr:DUF397 domain-containing protein [Streptomyces dysideae]KUO19007.1 DNA-binding protein [Streptomyces dysideae]